MRHPLIVLFLLSFFCVAASQAQPVVLEWNDFPSAPGTVITSVSSNGIIPINVGSPGTDQTWDFSTTSGDDEWEQLWVDPAETEFADDFPEATHCAMIAADTGEVFNFSRFDQNTLWFEGMAIPMGPDNMAIDIDNTEPMMNFPVQYEDEWASVFSWTIYGGAMSLEDSVWTVVDGWGTLIVDDGEYECLRFNRYELVVTSIMGFPPIVDSLETRIYQWVVPGMGPAVTVQSAPGITSPDFTEGFFDRVTSVTTGVADDKGAEFTLPSSLVLYPAYPNPFNSSATIRFAIAEQSVVDAELFDMLGRRVAVLLKGELQPGEHRVSLDGTPLSSGTYLLRVSTPYSSRTGRIVLLK